MSEQLTGQRNLSRDILIVNRKLYPPGGFLKWWVYPTNPWVFLLKMIILGWRLGVPPFKETPIQVEYVWNTGLNI